MKSRSTSFTTYPNKEENKKISFNEIKNIDTQNIIALISLQNLAIGKIFIK
jgi:hypothetical protein